MTINQVITDPELVEKSQHLEAALHTSNLLEYCNYKIESAADETQSSIWKFILVIRNFIFEFFLVLFLYFKRI